jgi:hypothetical protein
MKTPREEPDPEERSSKPTRLQEARRIVEEYTNDLREITSKKNTPNGRVAPDVLGVAAQL